MLLNWKELLRHITALAPQIEGCFVERVIIPERPQFSQGFIKGEFALRLSGQKQERTLILSVRTRHPYVYLVQGKGPRAAEGATHSAFDLGLSKYLRGARVAKFETLPRERVAVLWFTGGASEHRIGLALSLIPATPEAILFEDVIGKKGYPVLARSRAKLEENSWYLPPDGSKAPDDLEVRAQIPDVEAGLAQEAFTLRSAELAKLLRERIKTAQKRATQSKRSLDEALAEPDYKKWGELLKSVLHEKPPLERNGTRLVMDYEVGEKIAIPCDRKLDLSAQVEKFFSQAKRAARRIEEARSRYEHLSEDARTAEALLAKLEGLKPGDFSGLDALALTLGLGGPQTDSRELKRRAGWSGKTFVSHDGWPIWVGRSRIENLDLTFKQARGNDVWMHLRGRPGCHVVIPVPSGKSVPLETLLDAAVLTVYFSGGEKWGKTEVDYTFKKYVKRIKDSTEASYTQNKTLNVTPEPARIKRLMG